MAQATRPTGFYRKHDGINDALVCDDVPLADIAEAAGTPVYVYSAAMLRERYHAIDGAFGAYPHAVHYALKANSALAIARLLRELGSSVDANSVWEIEVARKAGFEPSQSRQRNWNRPSRWASRRSTSNRQASWPASRPSGRAWAARYASPSV